MYCVYAQTSDKDDARAVEADRLKIAAALASDDDELDIPEKYANAPAILKYLAVRNNSADAVREPPTNWLQSYRKNIESECGEEWAKNSISFLKRLQKRNGDNLSKVSKSSASAFLDDVKTGRAAGTRNRALAACNRFYNWAITTGRLKTNPFAGIKQLKEPKKSEIVYCTRQERDRIIKAAQKIGRADWLALVIAFYAGCRRGEIFRLEWKDVSFEARKFTVQESKTDVPRTVVMNTKLAKILKKYAQDFGYVIPSIKGMTRVSQSDQLVDDLRDYLAEPKFPNESGRATGVRGKRKYIMSDKEKREILKAREKAKEEGKLDALFPYSAPKVADDGKPWIPGERIGWNAWRHTFGSLLAQDGVSLDKICSWMGNTPEVCRRHYTQFVPRDRHDEDIDKL